MPWWFSSSVILSFTSVLEVLVDSSKEPCVYDKRVAFTKQLQTRAKKWNVFFFFFTPEQEMVFLAENFKMNQTCIFKIPGLLIKNWSVLCEV